MNFTGLTPSLASVSSDFKLFRKKQFSFFAFVRHYLRNLFWFIFLKLLRCFSSLGSFLLEVSPFGYLYFSVPSIQFSLFASFRIRPRHPWEALLFLFYFLVHCDMVPVFTVFSCIRCFISRFGMLLKSFLAAQCTMNRIGFLVILSLKNIFQQQLPLPLPCYDFTSIKLNNFDPSINIHFFVIFVNQWNLLLVYFWVLQKIPSLKVWRAVCTKLRYIFTEAFWSSITNNSCFMSSSCRAQSVLGCDL